MDTRAYFDSINSGDLETLKRLLAAAPALLGATSAPSYAPDKPLRCTGLRAAVHARRPEIARLLVDAGIDIEAKTLEGRTALHDSIEDGVVDVTDLLLERGAEVDICTAAILGRLDRVRELLDADPARANDRATGLSPLGWASFGNRVDTAGELIRRGARMDDGELICAASVGHVEVGRLLIERGADPDEVNPEWGGNALHAASAMRYTNDSRRFVEMLLERGADPMLTTTKGLTALQIAEQRVREQEASPEDAELRQKDYAGIVAVLREAGVGTVGGDPQPDTVV